MENDRTLTASTAPLSDSRKPGAVDPTDYAELVTVETSHYAIEREIARGGMGRIFAARDRRLGRRVAIKELLVIDKSLEARFEREARITARLQHPAIVNVHEAGRWKSGAPFYVMQLVSGKPLDTVIAGAPTLPERLALLPNVIATVDALAYAHSERVIHRDLKPSNVLCGSFGETVVIDWGLAKDLMSSAPSLELEPVGPYRTPDAGAAAGGETVVGSILGTPAYMPPEQASGESVDERADVYSLGAMLYHVVAGLPPYTGNSADQLLDKVVAGDIVPLAKSTPDAPADLCAIVDKAMARDPAERFATAKELAAELKRFQTGQLVSVHRYSLGEMMVRAVRRHRGAFATGGVLALALAATAVVSVGKIVNARDAADDERAHVLEEQGRQELVAHRPGRALAYLDEAWQVGLREPSLELLRDRARAAAADISSVAIADAAIASLSADRVGDVLATTVHEDTRAFGPAGMSITLPPMDGQGMLADDGSTIVIDKGGRQRVYDLHTGALRSECGDGLSVTAVGRDRFVSKLDKGATLWDSTTNPATAIVHQDGIAAAYLGTWRGKPAMIAIGGDGGKLRAIDARSGAELETIYLMPFNTIDLVQPTMSGWLLVTSRGETSKLDDEAVYKIHAIDSANGHAFDVEVRSRQLAGVSITPRGEVIGAWDSFGLVLVDPALHRTITRIDIAKPDEIEPLEVDNRPAFAVLVDGVVSIYDATTGLRTHVLDGHAGRVTELVGTGDGIHIVTGGDDGRIVTWAPHARIAVATRSQAHAIAPAGDRMAVIDAGRAQLVGAGEVTFDVATPRAIDVAWGANRAAIVDDSGAVAIASFAGKTTARLDASTREAVFDPTGEQIATADRHGARLWRADGHLLATLTGQRDVVSLVRWAPDGRLITAGDDGQVIRWSNDGTRQVIEDGKGTVRVVATSPRWLVVGSGDGWVRVYDDAGAQVVKLVGHGAAATALAISPDGASVASGGMDGRIRLWSLPDGRALGVLEHGEPISGLAFRGDGAILASGGDLPERVGTVKLWNAATGALLDTIDQPGEVRFADHAVAIRGAMGSALWRTPALPGLDDAHLVWRLDAGRLVQRRATPLLPAPVHDKTYDFSGDTIEVDKPWPKLTVASGDPLAHVADQLRSGALADAAAATAAIDGTSLGRADSLLVLAYARDAAGDGEAALRWARAALAKQTSPAAVHAVAQLAARSTVPVRDVIADIAATQVNVDADIEGPDPKNPDGLLVLAASYFDAGRDTDALAALDATIAAHQREVDAYLAKARIASSLDRMGELVVAFDGAAKAAAPGTADSDAVATALGERINALHSEFTKLRLRRLGDAARALYDVSREVPTSNRKTERDFASMLDIQLASRGVGGSSDKTMIRRVVTAHKVQLAACYERALVAHPDLAGTVTVEMTIDATGAIDQLSTSELADGGELSHCIEQRVATWRFHTANVRIVIDYPFTFRSLH